MAALELMRRSRIAPMLVTVALLTASCVCSPHGDREKDESSARDAIQATMDRYMVAARAVDADAAASFFTPTATLFEPGMSPVTSREAIRRFMSSFPGVRVEIATVTADEIEIFGDTAFYWGSYFERLAFPGQPLSEQHGKFVIEWKGQSDGEWWIERYFRVPLPDAQAPHGG